MNRFRPVDPAALGIRPNHARIDTTFPSPARVYDYLLGGKDNYACDRELAGRLFGLVPDLHDQAHGNRRFLQRTARYLALEGIDQFVDIGTGLPTAGPTHQVAQAASPGTRVAYVDNDPAVLAHGRALLVENVDTSIVQADLREPETITEDPRLAEFIDFDRPVAVLFIAVLHFAERAEDILAYWRKRLVPGSAIVVSHLIEDPRSHELAAAYRASEQLIPRSEREIAGLFGDWELVTPGLVPLHEWRPDTDHELRVPMAQGAVGTKPRP